MIGTKSNKSNWNYRFEATWSSGENWWDYPKGYWAEIWKKKDSKWNYLGSDKVIKLKKVGNALKFPFRAKRIGSPSSYGVAARVLTSGENCDEAIICSDEAGMNGELVHYL